MSARRNRKRRAQIKARRRRIALVGSAAAILVALGIGAYLLFLRDDGRGTTQVPAGPNLADEFAGGPTELLYQFEDRLFRADVAEAAPSPEPTPGTGEEVATITEQAAVASTTSKWIVYQEARDDPVIHIVDPETGDDSTYGVGVNPAWNGDGSHLAFLRPTDEVTECEVERCRGPKELIAVDTSSGEESVLLGPDNWRLQMWVGDHVLVSDPDRGDRVLSVGLDGSTQTLPVSPRALLAASPDGRWLMVQPTIQAPESGYYRVRDGAIEGDLIPSPFEVDAQLLQAVYSHDSSRVAVIAQRTADPAVVLTAADGDDPTALEGLPEGVRGSRLMWSPDNDAIGFSRLDMEGNVIRLEWVYCPLENEPRVECTTVLRWGAAVTPLRLQ